jgi:hypothetical protein
MCAQTGAGMDEFFSAFGTEEYINEMKGFLLLHKQRTQRTGSV